MKISRDIDVLGGSSQGVEWCTTALNITTSHDTDDTSGLILNLFCHFFIALPLWPIREYESIRIRKIVLFINHFLHCDHFVVY